MLETTLTKGFNQPIRDGLWGHVYMTDELAEITASALFMRLCRIMQLGPVYLVYPGATHTRASHSIGVYHLGRRLLQNLAERGASERLSPQGAMSFLCACLLHDAGHFPFTHSLKELPLRCHESLTAEIIQKEPMKSLVGRTGADPQFCAEIIDKELPTTDDEILFYRKLLSGALDPDKLDYLNRDAWYCGVPYGAQDVDFILSRLYPHKERGTDIDSRLIPNVEAVLFSKYLMYRTVYWHKQVRAATAMVKKALICGLESGQISGEELYGLDDMSLFSLLGEKTCNPLLKDVMEGRIYPMAVEIPAEKINISALKGISSCLTKEKQLKDSLGVEDIIIDLPEQISFETGLYVADENCQFKESSSSFKPCIINSFVQSLYTVRIFINKKSKDRIKQLPNLYEIVYNTLEG